MTILLSFAHLLWLLIFCQRLWIWSETDSLPVVTSSIKYNICINWFFCRRIKVVKIMESLRTALWCRHTRVRPLAKLKSTHTPRTVDLMAMIPIVYSYWRSKRNADKRKVTNNKWGSSSCTKYPWADHFPKVPFWQHLCTFSWFKLSVLSFHTPFSLLFDIKQ